VQDRVLEAAHGQQLFLSWHAPVYRGSGNSLMRFRISVDAPSVSTSGRRRSRQLRSRPSPQKAFHVGVAAGAPVQRDRITPRARRQSDPAGRTSPAELVANHCTVAPAAGPRYVQAKRIALCKRSSFAVRSIHAMQRDIQRARQYVSSGVRSRTGDREIRSLWYGANRP
jgi:hypothetical protein